MVGKIPDYYKIIVKNSPVILAWLTKASVHGTDYATTMIKRAIVHFIQNKSFLSIAAIRLDGCDGENAARRTSFKLFYKSDFFLNQFVLKSNELGANVSELVRQILEHSIDIIDDNQEEFFLSAESFSARNDLFSIADQLTGSSAPAFPGIDLDKSNRSTTLPQSEQFSTDVIDESILTKPIFTATGECLMREPQEQEDNENDFSRVKAALAQFICE